MTYCMVGVGCMLYLEWLEAARVMREHYEGMGATQGPPRRAGGGWMEM